jgi:hypothetical protein
MSGTFTDLGATVDSQHWVDFDTADGRKVFTLTGVAITIFQGGATGQDWSRQDLVFGVPINGLPAGKGLRIEHWAPFVTLNAISNDQVANNAGWAVDAFQLDPFPAVASEVNIRCKLAVRDVDGYVLRAGYTLTLLGSLENMDPLH